MINLQMILESIVNDEIIDASVIQYSGRGMFGRQCLAIVVDEDVPSMYLASLITSEIIRASVIDFFDEAAEDAVRICSEAKQDNMGKGTVFYWPDVEYIS